MFVELWGYDSGYDSGYDDGVIMAILMFISKRTRTHTHRHTLEINCCKVSFLCAFDLNNEHRFLIFDDADVMSDAMCIL